MDKVFPGAGSSRYDAPYPKPRGPQWSGGNEQTQRNRADASRRGWSDNG